MANDEKNSKRLLIGSIIFIVIIFLLMLAFSWLLTQGVEDEPSEETAGSTSQQQTRDDVPTEPSNPNVTGGFNGAGTGSSNDTSIETPSPAGGVDTDNDPANQ